jgi:hypothetical protein
VFADGSNKPISVGFVVVGGVDERQGRVISRTVDHADVFNGCSIA